MNAIAGRRALARTSKTPGRTQLINFFSLPSSRRFVDLPGYGFAKVPDAVRHHWRHLMGAYFNGRRSLRGLTLIMDVRRPLTEFDGQMLDWALAANCPVHALLTKADKLSRGQAAATYQSVKKMLADAATVQLFSATKKTGVDEARDMIERLFSAEHST